ncbi:MAG: HEAT repeat domain-containing protein, partial [Phycisphaerae bacterium]
MFIILLAAPVVALPIGVRARAQAPVSTTSARSVNQQPTVESLFADFLHYSLLGRFQLADTYALQLLDHPDLDPVELLKLSEKHERSMDTLLILIKNSSISESASRVMERIQEGEHIQRQDDDRIRANIDKLAGPPQTEYNATQRLTDSGEYAVPWMIQTLRVPARKHLRPRVIRALPKIGKSAVGPLVEALAINDETIRQTLIYTLGELAYTRAAPYLQALTGDPDVSPESKNAAMTAIARIGLQTGRPLPHGRGSVSIGSADGFVRLAEQFYDEHGSVGADPRLPKANVWYWDETNSFLKAIPVPREIYGAAMAMRCCERALLIDPNNSDAIAVWLAANIRREARLGMDVESGDADARSSGDPTRAADFPRALYFTSSAGPRFAHLALQRAVDDRDGPVALGAIAGLRLVSGASSLIGPEDHKQPLVQALRFPDLVVRIRAALTLGNALPRSQFRGSELVVEVLANALAQTGGRNILVVEPDTDNRNRIMSALRGAETEVIGESNVLAGIERARKEFEWLSGIFISTAVVLPQPFDAIADIRQRYEIAATPIVLLVRPQQAAVVDQILQADPAVESVDATAGGDALKDRLAIVAERVGQAPVTPERATELAAESLHAMRRIVVDGRTVFNVRDAEVALIAVLLDSADESLRTAAIEVLAP